MDNDIKTYDIIGQVTDAVMLIERHEIDLLEFVFGDGPDIDEKQCRILWDKTDQAVQILKENIALWNDIVKAKAAGHYRFLDEKPFRTAISRLKGAVLQARTVCGELAVPSR